MRYADDFVVFCRTKEDTEQAKEKLRIWLAERGLTFSEEKTRIVHLDEGFDFLGFNVRHYLSRKKKNGRVLLMKPSKDSTKRVMRKLKETFKEHVGKPVEMLIKTVNPIIRGWANYFRVGASAGRFQKLDAYLHRLMWRWTMRSHPSKGKKWLARKYWHQNGKAWIFGTKKLSMTRFAMTPIRRHIGVRRFASWDDPDLEQYFEDRKILELDAWLSSFKMQVAKQQGYVCPVCGEHLANGEDLHQHHLVPKKDGGKNVPSNYILVHMYCHQATHAEMRNQSSQS